MLFQEFACNGTVVEHPEYGEVIQLQGDQRNHIKDFLKKVGLAKEEQLKVCWQVLLWLYTDSSMSQDWKIPTDPAGMKLKQWERVNVFPDLKTKFLGHFSCSCEEYLLMILG